MISFKIVPLMSLWVPSALTQTIPGFSPNCGDGCVMLQIGFTQTQDDTGFQSPVLVNPPGARMDLNVTSNQPEVFYLSRTDYATLNHLHRLPETPKSDLDYLNRGFDFLILILEVVIGENETNVNVLRYLKSDILFGQAGNGWLSNYDDSGIEIFSAYEDWDFNKTGITIDYLPPSIWASTTHRLQALVFLCPKDNFTMPLAFQRFLQPLDTATLKSRDDAEDFVMASRQGFDLNRFQAETGIIGPVAANWFIASPNATASPVSDPMAPTYHTTQNGDGCGKNKTGSAAVDSQGNPISAESAARIGMLLWTVLFCMLW